MKYLRITSLTLALGLVLASQNQEVKAAGEEYYCYQYQADVVGGGSSTNNVCAYFTVPGNSMKCPTNKADPKKPWVPTNDELVASSCNHGK